MSRPSGTILLPVHHPASLFRNQTYSFSMLSDWVKAARVQVEGPTKVPLPFEHWQWNPTVDDVVHYFRELPDAVTSVDFEATLDGRVVCVAFWSCHFPRQHRGLCIPILQQGGGEYWDGEAKAVVMALLRDFFTDPTRGKIGHNLVGYDTGYIDPDGNKWNARSLIKNAWDIDVVGVVGDTMAAHYTCYSELRQNLAFLASMVTDLGTFKLDVWEDDDADDTPDAGKPDWVRILERPDEKTRKYCATDTYAQAEGWNELEARMA